MNQALLTELAEAAYEARMKLLTTGVYPKVAFQAPRSEFAPSWEALQEPDCVHGSVIREVYQKEAKAVVSAFLLLMLEQGNEDVKAAIHTLLRELDENLEVAKAESKEA